MTPEAPQLAPLRTLGFSSEHCTRSALFAEFAPGYGVCIYYTPGVRSAPYYEIAPFRIIRRDISLPEEFSRYVTTVAQGSNERVTLRPKAASDALSALCVLYEYCAELNLDILRE